jgi:hypothetical protein
MASRMSICPPARSIGAPSSGNDRRGNALRRFELNDAEDGSELRQIIHRGEEAVPKHHRSPCFVLSRQAHRRSSSLSPSANGHNRSSRKFCITFSRRTLMRLRNLVELDRASNHPRVFVEWPLRWPAISAEWQSMSADAAHAIAYSPRRAAVGSNWRSRRFFATIKGRLSSRRACSAVGSAPEWHSGGHRFDPGQVHHPPND